MKDRAYIVAEGETPQMIAAGFVGAPARMQELLDANAGGVDALGRPLRRVQTKDRFGRIVTTFESKDFRPGTALRLPAGWPNQKRFRVMAGTVGLFGFGNEGDDCGGVTDTTCVPPLVCQNDKCTRVSKPCGADADCAITEYCAADGTCKYGARGGTQGNYPTGGPCGPQGQCSGSDICQNGICRAAGQVVISTKNCTDKAIIMTVQQKLIAAGYMKPVGPDGTSNVDGAWGCISQGALDASGQTFKSLLGAGCQGQVPVATGCGAPPPAPECTTDAQCTPPETCQAGACVGPVSVKKKSPLWPWIVAGLAIGGVAVVAVGKDKKGRPIRSRLLGPKA